MVINLLREQLLIALESEGSNLISNTIQTIRDVLDCDMCTLWSINYNNTDKELGEFKSASLLERCMKKGMVYATHDVYDYVHPLETSFIEQVFKDVNEHETLYFQYDFNKDKEKCKIHKSFQTLNNMGLSYFICIPIIKNNKNVAFLKLAYLEEPSFNKEEDANKDDIIEVVNQAVVSAISRHLIYQKQQILNDLMENYRRQGIFVLKDLFEPIIQYIFRKYFYYEGSSVFIRDSFDNKYYMLATTGLQDVSKMDNVFYEKGEGITGMAAEEKQKKIYDDLLTLEKKQKEKKQDVRYKHKYRENTKHQGQTLLAVPIVRPSNPDDVFGIIRFTNKINRQSLKEGYTVIDYFNDTDVELIENASHYLALNIENYLAEEERRDFISKMSHEFKTPANSIRVSAYQIKRKFSQNDEHFMRFHFVSFLQDIIDFSELQLMQATTNLFLTKSKRKRKSQLTIDLYSIKEIIQDSISIVRPIARINNVRYGNIQIDSDFPNIRIKVDKNAFMMVFYNLLTNAIKYISKEKDFKVKISANNTSDGLIINVSDNGIGINSKDLKRIFLFGVRSKKASKINGDGYGIGLYVVKSILEMFDCEIRVSHASSPTTFEIKIPRKLFT